MLESIQQTNIGSINLEEPRPRPDLPFNPRVDLTEGDFWNLRQYTADSLVSSMFQEEYILHQCHFNLLSGQRHEDSLETSRNELIWESVKNRLHELEVKPKDLLSLAGAVKTVFPVRFGTFPWDKETLLDIYKHGSFYGFELPLSNLASFAIAFPEEDISTLKKDHIVFKREDLERINDPKEIWSFELEDLVGLRILSEEKFRELGLSNQSLLKMKRGLMEVRDSAYKNPSEDVRRVNWEEVLIYGAELAVICAEKVEITEKGLELTFPDVELLNLSVPALPETRKF
ncbi:MAG: hypothetical protein Q7R49_01900 [Candidatus Daviesbacteria bacterium]|nr:hypothetical protein [Candidatus Daviesbacteria bacterium]